MSEIYRVVFSGEREPGTDLEQVIDRFSEKFKLDRAIAEKVITAGKPVSLKKDLSLERAEKYLAALKTVGILVEIDPKPPEPEPAPSSFELEPLDHGGSDTTEVLERVPGVDQCPKCGSTNMEMGICQDCGIVASKYLAAQAEQEAKSSGGAESETARANPYNVPEADLEEESEYEMSGPAAVPIGQGAAWIGSGWGYFKASPLAWILAWVVWIVISMVLGFLPIVGAIISMLIGPVLIAGFMYGCSEQDAGGDFAVEHLFAGFSKNVGQLMLVGVFSAILMAVVAVVIVGGFFMLFGDTIAIQDPQSIQAVSGGAIAALVLLALALDLLVTMAFVFTPPLVMLDDIPVLDAMKLSFVGCLKNILPLLVFTLLAFVLMFLGLIPFGLGLLVVMPMLTGGLYAAYRDIYFG